MNQTYYTILTQKGVALLDNATSQGIPLKITQMAVGDGNGNITTPDATQTKLVHEVRRAAIDKLFVDNENPCQIIAEQVIPETDGGWFIHEIGLFDDRDNLIAVGNYPATYKPNFIEDSSRTQVIRMEFIVDNTEAIELKNETIEVFAARKYIEPRADATQTTATQKYVNDTITAKITAHEKSTNHPDATTSAKGFVQLNSAINSKLETQAATPRAVKKVYDKAVKRAGDTMTGQLTLSNKGLKINNANNDSMTLMTLNDCYSHVFYNAKTNTSARKLDYDSTENIWRFQNVKDVTINDKPVLKAGDYGIGSKGGAPLSNANDILLTGFYGTDTYKRPGLPDLGYDNYYSTLAVYGSGNQFCGHVEQLYVPTLNGPRVFGRSVFNFTDKMKWIESITEANINRFLTPVGAILKWPGIVPPAGYFNCNGAMFDIEKYPKLALLFPLGKLPKLKPNPDWIEDQPFIYIVEAK
ncbi:phage tail-collar fiber domain-containing protein [Gilliamella apicola]|uniref:phage tail-collar fiber domain-containing protein n=1 Tax=Gilliamella apicola TaxID=1196095 RepID=UPI003985D933